MSRQTDLRPLLLFGPFELPNKTARRAMTGFSPVIIADEGEMVYLITTVILISTVACYFLWGRKGLFPFGWMQWILRLVVVLPLLLSGIAHFTRTALMAMIIPPFFPFHPQLVLLSGALELAGAVGLLLPAFRRTASACLALLMIAIFPANVFAANQYVGGLHMPSVPVRLAMQVVYILLLLMAGWGVPRGSRESSE
jgi:uncharacterized membrane protein